VTIHPVVVLHKINAVLLATLKPLGIWGLGGLAFIDSGLFPLPTTMNGIVLDYVAQDHRKLLLYCLMAAAASAGGSLIPYYVGRAGGELFLLKRVNRERYESIRDKFERQEFLAIMVPAMCPPPMPIKLFEFAAGVFEMKPGLFAAAIFLGKLAQFLVWSITFVIFGPEIVHTVHRAFHEHPAVVLVVGLGATLAFVVYVMRKSLGRRRGGDETNEAADTTDIDSTLIT
jgi:membrane protein YqaA with SNARE-associated domain